MTGNAHARHSDPGTSQAAGRASFVKLKERACLLIAAFDRPAGLTSLDVQRLSELSDVRGLFGTRALGVSPWRRITDCVEEHWVEVLQVNGQDVTRLETNGKHQQVYRITPLGREAARQIRDRMRSAGTE